jgi:hypothetical protein
VEQQQGRRGRIGVRFENMLVGKGHVSGLTVRAEIGCSDGGSERGAERTGKQNDARGRCLSLASGRQMKERLPKAGRRPGDGASTRWRSQLRGGT